MHRKELIDGNLALIIMSHLYINECIFFRKCSNRAWPSFEEVSLSVVRHINLASQGNFFLRASPLAWTVETFVLSPTLNNC